MIYQLATVRLNDTICSTEWTWTPRRRDGAVDRRRARMRYALTETVDEHHDAIMDSGERRNKAAVTRWTPSTVYPGMWVDPDDDPRETEVETVDGRGTLLESLRRFRLTIEMKCVGLDAEQMARRSVAPSTMSLLGLVRHMAEDERHFRRMAGEDSPRPVPASPLPTPNCSRCRCWWAPTPPSLPDSCPAPAAAMGGVPPAPALAQAAHPTAGIGKRIVHTPPNRPGTRVASTTCSARYRLPGASVWARICRSEGGGRGRGGAVRACA